MSLEGLYSELTYVYKLTFTFGFKEKNIYIDSPAETAMTRE